jgi:hypothetical protein
MVAASNTFEGATIAYSLRALDGYTGNVVEVYEDTGMSTQSFTAAEVSDGTLATFCGSGGGFVRTWYDQSGNSNDAIQTTVGAMPQIVSSGSVITDNSLPTIDFLGTRRLDASGLAVNSGASDFSVYAVTGDTTDDTLFDLVDSGGGRLQCVINRAYSYFDGTSRGTGVTVSDFSILEYYAIATASGETYNDNVSVETGISYTQQSITNTGSSARIGSNATSGREMLKYSELIIFPSDKTADRTDIVAEINGYYSAY